MQPAVIMSEEAPKQRVPNKSPKRHASAQCHILSLPLAPNYRVSGKHSGPVACVMASGGR
eukprot:364227-Chlamydomonas_euryale.AAC.11